MKRVNIVTSNPYNRYPFRYLSEVACTYLSNFAECTVDTRPRPGSLNVVLHDTLFAERYLRAGEVAWLDTPLVISSFKKHWSRLYVCSRFEARELEELGVEVDGVAPRPVHPELLVDEDVEKKFDVLVFSKFYVYDRKNVRLAYESLRKVRCRSAFATDAPFIPNRVRYGSMSEADKRRLYKSSRFLLHIPSSEGFGMPVLESMASGTPVIYSGIPVLKEYAVGVEVPVDGYEVVGTIEGRMHRWIVRERDVVESIEYALSLDEDAYRRLSTQSRLRALDIVNSFTQWIKSIAD